MLGVVSTPVNQVSSSSTSPEQQQPGHYKKLNVQVEETVEILVEAENDEVNERTKKIVVTVPNNEAGKKEMNDKLEALDKKGLMNKPK